MPATAPATAPAPAALTPSDASYLIGVNFGGQLRRLGINDAVTLEGLSRGMKDGLGGKKTTPEEQRRLQEFVHAAVEAAVSRNIDAAREFLTRNGHEKGVHTTASGLEYKVLAAGDANAAPPTGADEVTVQYRGSLLDGTEFDSSYARGTPATFSLAGVIKGWQEALPMMKPGAQWRLYIPPELAYGSTPRPEIPGGSLLLFDVQLMSVKPAAAPAAPAAAPAMPKGPDSAPR